MMEFEEFCDYMKDHILEHFPEEYQDRTVRIDHYKVEGREETLLVISQPGYRFKPVVKMDPAYEIYQKGAFVEPLCKRFAELCVNSMKNQEALGKDADSIVEFARVKDQIYLCAMGVTRHKEMLEDLPHQVMGDMAVVCKIYMTPDARITIPINKDLLKEYGITENRLFEIATKNSERDYPVTLESLEEVVKAMNLGLELPTPEENRLYILTNSERMNGAAVLFYPGMCEKLAEAFPDGYYVLPSSTQECLIAPMEGYHGSIADCGEKLSAMIREINEERVSPEEQLSDYAHVYDPTEKKIVMCKDFEARSIEHRPDRTGR